MTIMEIGYIVLGFTLMIQSYWDLRYKEIPIMVTAVSGVVGLLLSFIGKREWIDVLIAFIPGLCCLGIGRVTRQAIGYGDGFLLCGMAMYISCRDILSVSMMAVMMSGVVALVCIAFQKKKGKDQLPFVPFLAVAWIIYILVEKGVSI